VTVLDPDVVAWTDIGLMARGAAPVARRAWSGAQFADAGGHVLVNGVAGADRDRGRPAGVGHGVTVVGGGSSRSTASTLPSESAGPCHTCPPWRDKGAWNHECRTPR
jgi:hypothetical protein